MPGTAASGDAGPFQYTKGRTALEINAGGRDVPYYAVLDKDAVSVDAVDAFACAAVPHSGIVNLAAPDGDMPAVGRDLMHPVRYHG
jgi:hypothetical protein